eukprot:TRINITY_DN13505_c0_g1_i2.p1 TRINITY_DN13505_c0_g1~~TRINITY_DN13505_c0_g1_i2.p1  ORF type:complete len:211 (-),score=40.63 TRINITY_DN13505_c0_g1_i2:22-654(-)
MLPFLSSLAKKMQCSQDMGCFSEFPLWLQRSNVAEWEVDELSDLEFCRPCTSPNPQSEVGAGGVDGKCVSKGARCACCPFEPELASSLERGFWRRGGLCMGTDSADSLAVRATLIQEVEREAQMMSPGERLALVFACHETGEQALQVANWDTAGDSFMRALAWAGALDETVDVEAWLPDPLRNVRERICSEVSKSAALLNEIEVQRRVRL